MGSVGDLWVNQKLMTGNAQRHSQLILGKPIRELTNTVTRAARFKIIGIVNSKQVMHYFAFSTNKLQP